MSEHRKSKKRVKLSFFFSSLNIYLFCLPFPESYWHVLLTMFQSLALWVFICEFHRSLNRSYVCTKDYCFLILCICSQRYLSPIKICKADLNPDIYTFYLSQTLQCGSTETCKICSTCLQVFFKLCGKSEYL